MSSRAESRPAASGAPASPGGARDYREALAHPDLLRIGRLPIHFFVLAVFSFAAGVAAAPLVIGEAADFFYQPLLLALVHTFTLGWITATIMGVMYRYVPALTRHPVPYPRMALAQMLLFALAASGMVTHFAIGIWFGTWLAAAAMVLSVLMFAANIAPCLWRHLLSGVAETGMFLSVCFLVIAAALGFTLALDKSYGFLGGTLITNLASHAHFAAVGWVTLTICAVSYRMLPAFLLPKITLPKSATWQLYGLAAGAAGLSITLLFQFPGVTAWGAVIAASLIAYMATIGRLVRTRRMPIDWTTRHALAGIAWLVAAIALGLALSVIGAGGEAGNRIAGAYGVLGLFGWISNFIIGMSYQLFPGFVARARTTCGYPAATIAELSQPAPRPWVFTAFNGGIAVLAAALLLGSAAGARIGAVFIAAGGLPYAAVTLWTLSFAYRRSLPASAATSLRILAQ